MAVSLDKVRTRKVNKQPVQSELPLTEWKEKRSVRRERFSQTESFDTTWLQWTRAYSAQQSKSTIMQWLDRMLEIEALTYELLDKNVFTKNKLANPL